MPYESSSVLPVTLSSRVLALTLCITDVELHPIEHRFQGMCKTPMQAMNLIHEWPVEPWRLPIRLGSHQQEPSAFYSVHDCDLTSPAQQDDLGRLGRASVGTELSLALQH